VTARRKGGSIDDTVRTVSSMVGLETWDHFAWTLLDVNYHLTSLTQPDGVEELQRKRGQIAKLSRLSLRLGKVRA